ncbi:ester cyclase [Streptomyces thinghirensis]|nr:ester cyclase [Streptomyces thinghirensis]
MTTWTATCSCTRSATAPSSVPSATRPICWPWSARSRTARFAVRDVQANYNERYAGLRVAVMWTMHGTYRGTPAFGALTGQPVTVLGVSQFLIQNGRIVREYRVYDEISLRAQINAARGDGTDEVDANIY